MMEMVLAGVEGLYVWHAGEERGCLGSNYVAGETPEVLDGIQYAIAFDRRGTESIITHQLGRETCSEAFAVSLGAALNLLLLPDDGGVYTDTEVYADDVPECTNVSVGYEGQHGPRETQDLDFALLLRRHCPMSDQTLLSWARL